MTPDEALRRVRDPHEVLQLTDVELTEAAVTLAIEVLRLRPVRDAAQRYSTATRDPGGETEDERRARELECNQAWHDLNDALARY